MLARPFGDGPAGADPIGKPEVGDAGGQDGEQGSPSTQPPRSQADLRRFGLAYNPQTRTYRFL
jgi:hypothetical protein